MVHETASDLHGSGDDLHSSDGQPSRIALDALVDRVRRDGPSPRTPIRVPGGHALVILAAAALVGFLGWWFLARPAPLEERMPNAAEPGSVEAAAGSGVSPGDASGDGELGANGGGVQEGDAQRGSVQDSARSGSAQGGSITVHIAGAVFEPGLVTLAEGARVADAVTAASGLTAVADLDRTNLAARIVDGARVFIPVKGQPVPGEVMPSGGSSGSGPGGEGQDPVDLNSADSTQLESLPGVGPATAEAIISHRDAKGPFESVDALIDVRGIGEAKLEALRDLVSVP